MFTLKQVGGKAREKKYRVHVSFMDLKKVDDSINGEGIWQVLKMFDVGGKLLNSIMSMYVNGLTCVLC